MNIYVIRHGQTDFNKEKIMLSITDVSLNDTGVLQAEEARKIVDNLEYDLIISSPLKRTIQTANIINRNNKKEIITDKRLIERNAGILERKRYNWRKVF